MRENKELLLDIINKKKQHIQLLKNKLENSLDMMDKSKYFVYEYDLKQKQETIEFLDVVTQYIKYSPDSGIEYLRKYIKVKQLSKEKLYEQNTITKERIVKELIKEYKKENSKNYFNNKYLSLNGLFNNELFCNIIKEKINKYTYCNKVTKTKYKHLASFLTEFLYEMENSKDPLKTLKHKMKLYQKYKKTEYIEIRSVKKTKIEIIKEILEEYREQKKEMSRCS